MSDKIVVFVSQNPREFYEFLEGIDTKYYRQIIYSSEPEQTRCSNTFLIFSTINSKSGLAYIKFLYHAAHFAIVICKRLDGSYSLGGKSVTQINNLDINDFLKEHLE